VIWITEIKLIANNVSKSMKSYVNYHNNNIEFPKTNDNETCQLVQIGLCLTSLKRWGSEKIQSKWPEGFFWKLTEEA